MRSEGKIMTNHAVAKALRPIIVRFRVVACADSDNASRVL